MHLKCIHVALNKQTSPRFPHLIPFLGKHDISKSSTFFPDHARHKAHAIIERGDSINLSLIHY